MHPSDARVTLLTQGVTEAQLARTSMFYEKLGLNPIAASTTPSGVSNMKACQQKCGACGKFLLLKSLENARRGSKRLEESHVVKCLEKPQIWLETFKPISCRISALRPSMREPATAYTLSKSRCIVNVSVECFCTLGSMILVTEPPNILLEHLFVYRNIYIIENHIHAVNLMQLLGVLPFVGLSNHDWQQWLTDENLKSYFQISLNNERRTQYVPIACAVHHAALESHLVSLTYASCLAILLKKWSSRLFLLARFEPGTSGTKTRIRNQCQGLNH